MIGNTKHNSVISDQFSNNPYNQFHYLSICQLYYRQYTNTFGVVQGSWQSTLVRPSSGFEVARKRYALCHHGHSITQRSTHDDNANINATSSSVIVIVLLANNVEQRDAEPRYKMYVLCCFPVCSYLLCMRES